jgi:penicillin-binding protein 1A
MKLSKFFLRLFIFNCVLVLALALAGGAYLYYVYTTLPHLISVEDYKPLLSTDIYARDGEKIGELYQEGVRTLVAYEDIPPLFIKSFLAAEDDSFFEHGGFNWGAILRAVWINFRAGHKRQGASTISQQTARTLFLSSEKTYTRKLREALLTYRMEQNLAKEEILYLYLNQIYLGRGAWGIGAASETYFRKTPKELSLAEMAMIAGLPTSPSQINPVSSPAKAKERQLYVLNRMVTEKFITPEEAEKATQEVLKVQTRKSYKETGPYFVETVRQLLVKEIGEKALLEDGLQVYTSLDVKDQAAAIDAVHKGLRAIDKRRGWRGAKAKIDLADEEAVNAFLKKERDKLAKEQFAYLELQADGTFGKLTEFAEYHEENKKGEVINNIPPYIHTGDIVQGLVTKVDDSAGLAYVSFAEGKGVIPIADMAWARRFNPDLFPGDHLNIRKPSQAVSAGDVVDVRVIRGVYTPAKVKKSNPYQKLAHLGLDQEPEVQGALISFDMETKDIIAMVGGLDFVKQKFNRSYQAIRQTGSAFKPIVYAAGLEKGLTLATPIMGAPIVFGGKPVETTEAAGNSSSKKDEEETVAWKPENYDGKFTGDVLMRTALKRSLNTPTIRVLEKATVPFVAEYARRLGIFSPLNMDLSLALGSSGVSLYEMNKAISVIGSGGKRFAPIIVREVKDRHGNTIAKNLSLDLRFKEKLEAVENEFNDKRVEYKQALLDYQKRVAASVPSEDGLAPVQEKPPVNAFFFDNPDQLISPLTAYLTVNLMQGVLEPDGTGGRAAAIGRPAAGKTGTTNGYYDAWFLGMTAQISTSVWVGLDTEKTLGKGETGGGSALPMWLPYMQEAHKDLPVKYFDVPEGIVFESVDKETGKASTSPSALRMPFIRGTEPGANPMTDEEKQVEEKNFLRESF